MTGFRLPGVTTADDGFWKTCPGTTEGQEKLAVVAVYRHCPEGAEDLLEMLGLADVATAMLAGAQDGAAASLPADDPTTGSAGAA